MNAISKALQEIRYSIPDELLNVGFNIDNNDYTINVSLDEKIRTKVIYSRVLVDCNIVGGVHVLIPLSSLTPSYWANFYTVYNIPSELIDNRFIVSALNLVYVPMSQYYSPNVASASFGLTGYMNTPSSVEMVGSRIGTAQQDTTLVTNAHVEIIGHNTIAVYANYTLLGSYALRCLISNEENLSNISPRSYKDFANLCVLAVKSYLYNKLIIKVNMGYLQSGQELGEFKNILNNYSEAEEQYNTYLKERWQAVAAMNDTANYHRLLKSMMHPGL